jgi:DNA mismatch endonuclease (patch repair protein)
MARMPTHDTWPEREMIAAIRRVTGTEPLTQVRSLPGTPDAVIPAARVAFFAQGCFWHHHGPGCRLVRVPQTGFDWRGKFARNQARDMRVRAELFRLGYRVSWFWECALRGAEALPREELDAELAAFVGSDAMFAKIEGRRVRRRRVLRVV